MLVPGFRSLVRRDPADQLIVGTLQLHIPDALSTRFFISEGASGQYFKIVPKGSPQNKSIALAADPSSPT